MHTIKLILGGQGAECYVHDINNVQRNRLIDEIDNEQMDINLACNILNIDFIENGARIYTGAYPEEMYLAAYDEDDNLIFECDSSFSFANEPDDGWIESVESFEKQIFIVQDYIKGDFMIYHLSLESDFDPGLLSPIMIDVAENAQIIIGLKYNGQEPPDNEAGEYWSKGLFFYLYP